LSAILLKLSNVKSRFVSSILGSSQVIVVSEPSTTGVSTDVSAGVSVIVSVGVSVGKLT